MANEQMSLNVDEGPRALRKIPVRFVAVQEGWLRGAVLSDLQLHSNGCSRRDFRRRGQAILQNLARLDLLRVKGGAHESGKVDRRPAGSLPPATRAGSVQHSQIGCNVLNFMTDLGMPASVRIT
jgi:hypothetical protein